MRLPINHFCGAAVPFLLAGCAFGGSSLASAPVVDPGGPSADYPVLVGEPFTIDAVNYTPEDVMNYDQVGFALAEADPASGVSGSHKTLPLPSYVEVTNLDSGRTILVRLDTRGPMRNDALVGLSPAAAAELAIPAGAKAAVRVRRVNPPEAERAMLRAHEPVPARMDTPPALLSVLKRKLDGGAGQPRPTAAESNPAGGKAAETKPVQAKPVQAAAPKAAAPETVSPEPAPVKPSRENAGKGTFVQVGAFSSEDNARKAAASVGAAVSKSGRFWVVRLGPLSGKAEVDATLAKARGAGYGDAIVRRVD